VQLLKPLYKILGYQVWKVRVVAIVEKASFGGNPKVGQIQKLSERWFVEKQQVLVKNNHQDK
jgi:hypothetical protein